jgi:hypothetical protein
MQQISSNFLALEITRAANYNGDVGETALDADERAPFVSMLNDTKVIPFNLDLC